MRRKDPENEKAQRAAILAAAMKLFREKGYEQTTLQDILAEVGGSKGKFYYYFSSKAELLSSMYQVFDEKYLEIYHSFKKDMDANEKMVRIQTGIFRFLENEVGHEMLTDLYLIQLQGSTKIDFWDTSRVYFEILKEIITQAVEEGQVRSDIPVEEIAASVIVAERGQFIDWCLHRASYSLSDKGIKKVAVLLGGFGKIYENFRQFYTDIM